MPWARGLLCGLAAGVVLAGAACSNFEPYVYNRNEFNREAPGFGQKPTDIKQVDVCYNRSATTPEQVRDLAREACGEFGKEARFSHHRRLECPLMTPILARFKCIGPEGASSSVR